MNIHEYQAKGLLSRYGVATPRGAVAYTPEEAADQAELLGGSVWVVKAQIHAGGRGKAGGVKVVKSIAEVRRSALAMLGTTLVTPQTGPAGREVKRLYVEEGLEIARELYVGMLVDRVSARVTVIASTEGGMEIEEVARDAPEKILQISIDPVSGLQAFHARRIAFALGLGGQHVSQMVAVLGGMYRAFVELDASTIEVNPLVITGNGKLVALDAKMSFDANALFRHTEVEDLRDESEENPVERMAARQELSYVKLDGNIGCLVNGAGLAMATMDIIKLYGAEPANFLDVGGGATKERVTAAFKIILSDPSVEAILVNIFGGIMRCDVIAEGVVTAAREVSLQMPLVVRLEGTNVALGKKILAESGLAVIAADNLADAAEKVVRAVKEAR
ncbi:MAG: ADP-forming succinate--CoA ligase subunit beta [Alphaproteobacteria bacterium]|nr:ADP-forming succinate--CoA ligase subunit beta [Alphaproteobacteria bacterium]